MFLRLLRIEDNIGALHIKLVAIIQLNNVNK